MASDSFRADSFSRGPSAEDRPPDCDYGVGASAALTRAGIFPLRLCCCLPLPMKAMVPSTCHVIQDFTHLAMVAGSASAGFILMKELYNLFGKWELLDPAEWWEPALTIVATAPNLAYMIKLLGRYDEQIMVKEKAINEKKKELSDSYSNLVQSMDDLLGKAAESSATMAERGFESKRRDFQRFLERAESRYREVQASFSQADKDQLVVQFRRFVQRWLTVFMECSVDPIGHPKMVVSEAELAQCWTIAEIAGLTLERLKATEVKFISARCDQDKKLLKGFRAQHRKLTVVELTPLQAQSLQGLAKQSKPPLEIEMSSSLRSRLPSTVEEEEDSDGEDFRARNSTAATSRGGRPTVVAAKPVAMLKRWLPCGWLAGGSFGVGCTTGGMPGGWPRTMQCKCAQLILLSQEHLALMVAWTCVVALFVLEAFIPARVDRILMLGVFPYFVALCILVVKFEQIDVVQRLEREVQQLKEESESVQKRREQMVSFWNGMQEMTDVWVHRTVPRLDLLKEVQQYLEFVEPEMCLSYMGNANSRLEELERRLPALEAWKIEGSGGRLSEASKKAFSAKITGLCREDSLEKLVIGLQSTIQDDLPKLADAANRPRAPSGVAGTSFKSTGAAQGSRPAK